MSEPSRDSRFVFPRWANVVVPLLLVAVLGGVPYQILLVGLGAAPSTTDVGYQPTQPIPYSHELHVNQLGLDCRYCHTTVEKTAFAAIPSANICMNCHHAIRKLDSDGKANPKLAALYNAFKTGDPVKWVKVHDLPDYAYFNHSAHINKGVSCVSCHGRVDHMGSDGVYQHEDLSMGWCLKCHRNPTPNLRPTDQVTNLMWGYTMTQANVDEVKSMGLGDIGVKVGEPLTKQQREEIGHAVFKKENIRNPIQMSDCSLCHR